VVIVRFSLPPHVQNSDVLATHMSPSCTILLSSFFFFLQCCTTELLGLLRQCLTIELELSSNSRSSCLSLLSAGSTVVCHHTRQLSS
jgi:hypothetical protein